ncbi:ABC transporter ATP-binding protein [Nocardiopsis xinjiangensis]|uniref:ABC transporter ATP-binding protein n=1 Tax=Nocardiopsis xinjiangensis TaxID=124285 RepID=UPI0003462BBF|nr:ATP-binding cassette domain-containing protein [Nocardiopsis xinjiangensis]
MINIADLTKHYGDHTAVDGLSFTAAEGKVTGFLGPNGAGKSTTLRILLGLQKADRGTATLDGRPYREIPRPLHTVGSMIDAESLPTQQTSAHFLGWLARSNRIDPGRGPQVLEQVGLAGAARKKIGAFSLGMRQRLGLAVALLGDPRIVVLDEPVNGLDPEGIIWIRNLLRGLADEGRTVLLSSHLLDELSQIADELVVIGHGRLITQTVPELLLSDVLGHHVLARTSDNAALAARLADRGVGSSPDGAYLKVDTPDCDTVGDTAFSHGLVVLELFERTGSLEEAFLALTGGEDAERDT